MARPQDQRRSARIPVSMTVQSEELNPVGFGYVCNISAEGLGVDAKALVDAGALPTVGTTLKLKFKIPTCATYTSIHAKVVYVEMIPDQSPRIGFSFIAPAPDLLQEIQRYAKSSS